MGYLYLFIICRALVLRLVHATGGAPVLIWTCWGLRQQLVATRAEYQHRLVYYATDQCRKRLEACINVEGGHSEHLLWHCLPDIPHTAHHNQFFSEPPTTTGSFHSEPPTFGRRQQNFSQIKKSFAIHKLVWWHFQVGWASGLQLVFFWDNIENQKYVWIIMLKITFLDFPKVKWLHLTRKVGKFVRFSCQKSVNFWQNDIVDLYAKYETDTFTTLRFPNPLQNTNRVKLKITHYIHPILHFQNHVNFFL